MRTQAFALTASALLLLGACGGDDGDSSDSSSATSSAATASSSATSSAASSPSTTTASTTGQSSSSTTAGETGSDATGTPIEVSLHEWEVDAPATLSAGPQEFSITNTGEAPHELLVMQGTYASLPKTDIGAVIEDEAPAGSLIGETARIEPGSSDTLSVDLPAGQYVLLCNISVGPNSHAGKGQWLDVTVS